MTISNKQCIEEAKKMQQELKIKFNSYDMEYFMRYDTIEELIERLEKLPEEPTSDMLLEEIRGIARSIVISHDRFNWYAEGYNNEGNRFVREGKTPTKALLALREKLNPPITK